MNIPDRIRIAGVEYAVITQDMVRMGNDICYGKISCEEAKIYISRTDCGDHQVKCVTLLHEILHGILRHYAGMEEVENEERIVEAMSKGLYQVLQDNGGRLFDLRKDEPVCASARGREGG